MCGRAVFSEGVAARSITASLLRGAQHVGPRAGSLPRQDRGPDSRGASRAAVGEHIEVNRHSTRQKDGWPRRA